MYRLENSRGVGLQGTREVVGSIPARGIFNILFFWMKSDPLPSLLQWDTSISYLNKKKLKRTSNLNYTKPKPVPDKKEL